MTIYGQLREKWLSEGIGTNAALTDADIHAFETKHAVELPLDFRRYLMTLNGMQSGETDEDLLSFFSLDVIDNELSPKALSDGTLHIPFADYSLWSHLYVLRRRPDGRWDGVYADGGDAKVFKQLAMSFEQFVLKYLADSASIAYCWK